MFRIGKFIRQALFVLALPMGAQAAPETAFSLPVVASSGATQRLELDGAAGWRLLDEGGTQPVKLVQDGEAGSEAQPLAVFLDRPTGSTFVYLPERGWRYLGRSGLGDTALGTMSLFIDGPSGFVFRYVAEQGWKFAGRVGERKL